MDAINYTGLSNIGIKTIDSNIQKEEELTSLEDGLTQRELKQIDQNKDGVVTEEEFKQLYGVEDESYKAVWNAYSQAFCNSSSKTDSNGNTIVTQKVNGNEIISTYNKDGELTAYTTKVKNTDGTSTIQNYSIDTTTGQNKLNETLTYSANGVLESKAVTADNGAKITEKYDKDGTTLLSTETVNPDKTRLIVDAKTGAQTKLSVDGTEITCDKNGKVTQAKFDGEVVKINYDSSGNVTSVVSTDKSGKTKTYNKNDITVDKNGKIIAKNGKKKELQISTSIDGLKNIYKYDSNEKLQKSLEVSSDGYPTTIYEYENGYYAKAMYCSTGGYRIFTRDENNKFIKSNDYNKDGVLLNEMTYYDGPKVYDNSNIMLWDSITYFDKDGNVTKYTTIDYSRNEDGTVNKTETSYKDKTKSELTGIKELLQDSYSNTLVEEKYDKEKALQKTTYTTYDEPTPSARKTDRQITAKKIVEPNGQVTLETYDCTKLMKKEVVGKYTETYTYHSTGAMATKLHEPADGKSYTLSTYRANGTKETETLWKSHKIYDDIIHNNKRYDNNGNLEIETNYEYFNEDTSNLHKNKITTTDGKGNLINLKVFEPKRDASGLIYVGHQTYEKDVYADGSSTETRYEQINSNYVPNSVTDKDPNGNVTKEQRTLFQIIKDKYPNLSTSMIKEICNVYITPYNNNIDTETLLTEEALKGVDLSHFEVRNGLVSGKK